MREMIGIDLFDYDVFAITTNGFVKKTMEGKKMSTFKVIIAGGREFNDFETVKRVVKHMLQNKEDVTIICGMARGADKMGYFLAKKEGWKVIEMPADWEKYGNTAGYRRNEEMAKIADACICFWDGKSKGTKQMIDLASYKYKMPLHVHKY